MMNEAMKVGKMYDDKKIDIGLFDFLIKNYENNFGKNEDAKH